jgi:hypothetical protein
MSWKIEARNYRCFTDSHPLSIDLSQKVTALVGPNNSGKTSALKFFWELGPLLSQIVGSIVSWQTDSATAHLIAGNIRATTNQFAVFTEHNARPIVIDMTYVPSPTDKVQFILKENQTALPISVRAIVERSDLHARIQLNHRGRYITATPTDFVLTRDDTFPILYSISDKYKYYWTHFSASMFNHMTYFPMLRTSAHAELHDTFDLWLGSSAITQWNSYKRSDDPNARKTADSIERELATIFSYETLDISTNENARDYVVKLGADIDKRFCRYLSHQFESNLARFATGRLLKRHSHSLMNR